VNAPDGPQPVSRYVQAMRVEGAREFLFISGQIPVTADGTVPESFGDQARLVWANIEKQLAAAGMTLDHLVKVTFFLSDRRYALEKRAIREAVLGERKVALTAIITGIFDSAWLLEIEAIAAR
jgi:enamine deaminase RidA (YjgF/YER057c/UK114 family)